MMNAMVNKESKPMSDWKSFMKSSIIFAPLSNSIQTMFVDYSDLLRTNIDINQLNTHSMTNSLTNRVYFGVFTPIIE